MSARSSTDLSSSLTDLMTSLAVVFILLLVGVFARDAIAFVPKDLTFAFGGTDAAHPWVSLSGQAALVVYQVIGGLMILLGLGLAGAFAYAFARVLEAAIPFAGLGLARGDRLALAIHVLRGDVELERLPRFGYVTLTVPDEDFERIHWRV